MSKMDRYKDDNMRFLLAVLKNVEAFRALSKHTLQLVLHKLHERKYLQNKIILNTGQKSDTCYLLIKGRVGVYVKTGVDEYESNDWAD